MAGLRRRILGITVISAGVCAALPFRNEPISAPVGTREAVELPTAPNSRDELTLRLTIPAAPDANPTMVKQPVATVTTTSTTLGLQEVRRDELQSPPSIASAFEPPIATVPLATFPVATQAATSARRQVERPRRHRIADGDTLEALATRYLGDRGLWRIIFEANSGLLTDPDILPIGHEILIPQVRPPSLGDADDHLVPIPPGLLNGEE